MEREEIGSSRNPLVKEAAALKLKKERQRQGLYLAEGVRQTEEAVAAAAAERIFYVPAAYAEQPRLAALLEKAAAQRIELIPVSEAVLKKIADEKTPQPVIALCAIKEPSLEKIFAQGKPVAVLDAVADPGNVGSILRTAAAAGAGGAVLLDGCADLYAPKTVRSAMGALYHLPCVTGVKEEELTSAAEEAGYELAACVPQGGRNLYKSDLRGRLTFIFGNEANGVRPSLAARAEERLCIPMPGRSESLNVAAAAAVVLFEAVRQRER